MDPVVELVSKFCRWDAEHQQQFVGQLAQQTTAAALALQLEKEKAKKKDDDDDKNQNSISKTLGTSKIKKIMIAPGYHHMHQDATATSSLQELPLLCQTRFLKLIGYSSTLFKTACKNHQEFFQNLPPMKKLLPWPTESNMMQKKSAAAASKKNATDDDSKAREEPSTLVEILEYLVMEEKRPVVCKMDGKRWGCLPEGLSQGDYETFLEQHSQEGAATTIQGEHYTRDNQERSEHAICKHKYNATQFVEFGALEALVGAAEPGSLADNSKLLIEALAHADHGMSVTKCKSYTECDNFCSKVRDDAMKELLGHPQFVLRMIQSAVNDIFETTANTTTKKKKKAAGKKKKRKKNNGKKKSDRDDDMEVEDDDDDDDDDDEVVDLDKLAVKILRAWKAGTNAAERKEKVLAASLEIQRKYPLLFQNVLNTSNLHYQIDAQTELSMYSRHKDKVDSIVLFHQLQGLSYNFVAVPSTHQKVGYHSRHNKKECQHYQTFKKKLEEEANNNNNSSSKSKTKTKTKTEYEKLVQMEKDFEAEAQELGLTEIHLYMVQAPDRLALDAKTYLHMTFIPARDMQPNNKPRVLMVHHGLFRKSLVV